MKKDLVNTPRQSELLVCLTSCSQVGSAELLKAEMYEKGSDIPGTLLSPGGMLGKNLQRVSDKFQVFMANMGLVPF